MSIAKNITYFKLQNGEIELGTMGIIYKEKKHVNYFLYFSACW